MRQLQKPESMESELQNVADDLKWTMEQLLALSAELVENGNEQASRQTAKMIVTLKEDESMLRKQVERLKAGRLGRRADD